MVSNEDDNGMEGKITKRKIQADTTRKKIYDISIALMEKNGFANTTIMDISRMAGVSVGTFYNYFSSKEEIFFDIFHKADEYFKRVVDRGLLSEAATAKEQIVLYYKYYARYQVKRGFHNIDQLYSTKTKLFIVKGRYMREALTKIVSDRQATGELVVGETADDIVEYLFIAARGVVYDWCLNEGKYNLETKMEAYMSKLVDVFVAEK
jgi:AcrR family transcriptional regulator